jgi:hypothetical protein
LFLAINMNNKGLTTTTLIPNKRERIIKNVISKADLFIRIFKNTPAISSIIKSVSSIIAILLNKLKTLKTFRRQIILPFSMGIILILIPVAYLILRHAEDVEAWFDDNWGYRVRYTINNSGSSETDKKILLEIDTETLISEGKMNEDCSDSGFTTLSGQVLKYYLDETGGACNTSSTNYWVLIPTIHSGTTVIYHYYGNPSAESSAQSEQFTQDTFDPTSITKGSEESSPGPTAYWRLDEGFDKQENSRLEQQIEIINDKYTASNAAWFDNDWDKRKVLEVVNTTDTELTNHPLEILVRYETDMKSDFTDLRFVDKNNTPLNYWIEKYTNGIEATVWVKFPNLASKKPTQVYMYYGNLSATDESNGTDVFTFFDDFSGSSVDTTKWTITNATGWSVSGGELRGSSTTGRLTSIPTFSNGTILEIKYRTVSRPSNGYMVGGFWTATNNAFGYLTYSGATSDHYRRDGSWIAIGTPPPFNTDLYARMTVSSPTATELYVRPYYDKSVMYHAYENISKSVTGHPILLGQRYDNNNTGQAYEGYWDWVRVRSLVESEPIHTFSQEEDVSTVGSFEPISHVLGIARYDPAKYNNGSLYFEAVVSTDDINWEIIRSNIIDNPSEMQQYTVKARPGDNDSQQPAIQLYNISGSEAVTDVLFGNPSDETVYVKAARLIILQTHPAAITDTSSQIEIGNSELTNNTEYVPIESKKIYYYDSGSYDPAPATYFEASLKSESLNENVSIEQQINIINQEYSTSSTDYVPEDNSLGLIHWDASAYTGATVYFEAVLRVNSTSSGSNAIVALHKSNGDMLSSSEVQTNSTGYTRLRSETITLDDDTYYTVRLKQATDSQTAFINSARLIIVQSDPTRITNTQTQIEIGNTEGSSNTSFTATREKKIYYYDSSKFSPAPTTYFEASFRPSYPKLEQQINIINQEYSTSSTDYVPEDNSLGLIHWDASAYTGATVYFEAVLRVNSTSSGSNAIVALHKSNGDMLSSSEVQTNSTGYTRLRSETITLDDDTYYTVRLKQATDSQTAFINSARLIIVQSDPTRITNTQTQIEIGNTEGSSNTSFTATREKKIYYYDSSKFSPAPTTYFEASFRPSYPKLEQQINIINQEYSTSSTDYVPEDNSLGLIHWDASAYTGATVYFEAVLRVNSTSSGSNAIVALHKSNGDMLSSSEVQTNSTGYTRLRSETITLDDDTYYTVRLKQATDSQTAFINSARLIIVQSDPTRITNTQTQIEIGNTEGSSNTSFTATREKKIYYYDSSKFSPAPTTYFEASFRPSYPKLEQQINIINQEYSTSSTDYVPEDNSLGLIHWDASAYTGATVYFEAVIRTSSAISGRAAVVALHKSNGDVINSSEILGNSTGYTRVRSGAVTLDDNTDYTIRIRHNTSGQTAFINAARLIIIQSDPTRITNTQTQIEVGANETIANTTYTQLTDKKIYYYDSSRFSPAPTVYFEATISNTSASDTTWAALYINDTSCNTLVAGSEVSVTGTSWVLARSGSLTLNNETEYMVCARTSSGGTSKVANAKIILSQQDISGVTHLETTHHHINWTKTINSAGATLEPFFNLYDVSNYGVFPKVYFETTLKGVNNAVQAYIEYSLLRIAESDVATSNTQYTRVRSSEISVYLPSQPFDIYTRLQRSGTSSNTNSTSNSWIILQIENLPTNGATGSVELYNITDGVSVAGSEISSTTEGFTLVRSDPITLTSGKEYEIRHRSSITSNAKIIHIQNDVSGITHLETTQNYTNQVNRDLGSSWSSQGQNNVYDPSNYGVLPSIYFENTIRRDSPTTGTAQVRLIYSLENIIDSNLETTSSAPIRLRSSNTLLNMPTQPYEVYIQTVRAANGIATIVSNSWIVIQVENLPTNGATGSVELYNITDGVSVAGSEISSTTEGFTLVRSDPITLTSGKEYEIRHRSSITSNAKIIHIQNDVSGITHLETTQNYTNQVNRDLGSSWSSQGQNNVYDPSNYGVLPSIYFENTIRRDSPTTGTAQVRLIYSLENIIDSNLETTSSAPIRLRSSNTLLNMPTQPYEVYIQTVRAANGIATIVSNSWIVIQVENLPTNGATGSVELYNITDGVSVAGSEISSTTEGFTLVRSDPITLTSGKEYEIRHRSSITSNAKIIHIQNDVNGISDLEVHHYQINRHVYTSGTGYSSQNFINLYNPLNQKRANFNYFFESVSRTHGSSTAHTILRDITTGSDLTPTVVSSSSTSYQRNRTNKINSDLPTYAKELDSRIRTQNNNINAYVNSSSLVVQIENLGNPVVHAALFEDGSSCSTMVAGSELIAKASDGWVNLRSASPINLGSENSYMVCTRSDIPSTLVKVANAKIIHEQSAPSGISKVETIQNQINMPTYDSDSSYTSQNYLNTYNPANFSGDNDLFFESTIKTSGGTGLARLYSESDGSEVTGGEISTTSSNYQRVRTSNLNTQITSQHTLDTQIRNSGSDTTTVSNSWLVIQSSFVAYAIIHDSTSNAIHGTLSGGSWNDPSACKAGSCLTFDGIDDHIFVNDNSRLDFKSTDNFTFSLWFKHPKKTSTNPSVILSKFEPVGSDGGYKVYMNPNGTVSFGISDTNTNFPKDSVTSSLTYDNNTWHHLSAVKKGTDGIYLYINGTLVGSNESLTTSGNLTNNDKLFIGIDGDGTSNPFRGVLDEVKVYRYARSDEGVLTDFVRKASSRGSSAVFGIKNETPLFNNLIGHWQMDESEAGTCSGGGDSCDSSGNYNNADWIDNPNPASGRYGNAIQLTGIDNRIMPHPREALGWFNTSWKKRAPISINNTNLLELSEYQIKISVDYNPSMKSDFGDLRFTLSDGTSLLKYWIESKIDSVSANVWVKVDVLPAESISTIYMYYDNENAVSTSDGSSTMILHEDMQTLPSGTLKGTATYDSVNKWVELTPASGGINGQLEYNQAPELAENIGFAAHWKQWAGGGTGADTNYFYTHTTSTATNFNSSVNGYIFATNEWQNRIEVWFNGSQISQIGQQNIDDSNWHDIVNILYLNDGLYYYQFWYDNDLKISSSSSSTPTGNLLGFGARNGSYTNIHRVGEFFIRKYSTPEPTTSIEQEEQLTTNLDNITDKITASAWINPSTLDVSSRAIISRGDSPTQDWFIQASGASPGKISFSADGGTNVGLSNTTLQTGKWYHIAMSAGEGKTSLYINGKLDSQTSFSGVITTEGDIAIGNNPSGGTGWHGLIDEVRLYNTSLSPSEILSLYKWTPGPQAYWNFNEGNGNVLYDKAGNNHAGIWKGTGEYWINGKFGKAGLFNGTNNYVEVGSSILGVRSVSFWVKPYTQTTSILSLNSSASVSVSSGTISATGFASPTIKVNGKESTTLSENTWQHVSITTDTPINADSIRLGRVSDNYYSGELDEVRIYDYVITQEQVVRNINVGHNAPGSPLGSASLHLAFDEGYGDTAHDTSPNNNHGSLAGTNTCPGHTSCPTWTTDGKFGKALYFDGVNDFVDMGTTVFTSPNEWTFSVWVKPESGMSNDRIIEYNPTTNGSISKYVSLYMTGTTLIYAGYSGGSWPTVSTTLTLNEWSHIVATYDGTRMALFVNAKEKGSNVTSLSAWGDAFNTYIGNNANNLTNGPFKGTIDELKIYDFALSSTQASTEYNQGMAAVWGAPSTDTTGSSHSFSAARAYCVPGDTSTCNPPIGEWRFDEKQGTTARDTSGNNNTGTLINNPQWVMGKIGGALNFDGVNNYVQINHSSSLGITNFSITAWIRYNSAPQAGQNKYIINRGVENANSTNYYLYYDGTNNRYTIGFYNGSTWRDFHHPTSVDVNTWYYLTATYNGSEVKFFINGTQLFSTPETGTPYIGGTQIIRIGQNRYLTSTDYFNGSIDDVRIYNYARTPTQIAWDYNRGAPIGHWQFNECSGTTAYDISGNNKHGTITIGPSGSNTSIGNCDSGVATEAWNNGTNGKFNSSISLDGTDDFVDIGNLGTNINTVSFWIKPDSTTQKVIDLNGSTHSIEIDNGAVTANGFASPSIYVNGLLSNSVIENSWNHITVTTTTGFSASNVGIGRVGTDYFSGQFDDVRLYNYPLTLSQIQLLLNNNASLYFGE